MFLISSSQSSCWTGARSKTKIEQPSRSFIVQRLYDPTNKLPASGFQLRAGLPATSFRARGFDFDPQARGLRLEAGAKKKDSRRRLFSVDLRPAENRGRERLAKDCLRQARACALRSPRPADPASAG